MATRFIHKGLPLESSPYDNVCPIGINENGVLSIRRGVVGAGHVTTDVGEEVVEVNGGFHALTATTTLVQADQYTTWDFGTATTVAVTLPPASKKCRFTFVQSVAPTTTKTHTIVPYTGDGIGGNSGHATVLGFDADKALEIGDATGVTVTLQGDGATSYYIIAATGTQTKAS